MRIELHNASESFGLQIKEALVNLACIPIYYFVWGTIKILLFPFRNHIECDWDVLLAQFHNKEDERTKSWINEVLLDWQDELIGYVAYPAIFILVGISWIPVTILKSEKAGKDLLKSIK